MERFAQLGKSCAPFARGDWNAALVPRITNHLCLGIPLVTAHLIAADTSRGRSHISFGHGFWRAIVLSGRRVDDNL